MCFCFCTPCGTNGVLSRMDEEEKGRNFLGKSDS